jgi:hypothetical protein
MATPKMTTNRLNHTSHAVSVALVLAMALLSGIAEAQLYQPGMLAANAPQPNSLRLSNEQAAPSPSNPQQFVPVYPCRVVDTRLPNGTFGGPPIQGGTFRSFPIPQGACNIPNTAGAYAMTVTVLPITTLSYLTVYPTGDNRGLVTTMNSLDGRIKSDAAIVAAGTSEAISVYATNTTNVVIDLSGYFAPASEGTLQFYPLAPCRVVDTRGPDGPLGGPYLQANQARNFPVPQSPCIPHGVSPQVYSMNFAVIPRSGTLQFLTVWPTGTQLPMVFTLTDPTGTILANAGLTTAGEDGAISAYPTNDTDLVVDINGYFAPPGSGGLSLYPTVPCRVFDSRRSPFGFSGRIAVAVDLPGNPCRVTSSAQAYVFNATVYPHVELGYLTLWADGQSQPVVATLEAPDGSVTSNMAIVPTINGFIDAYASNTTQLTLDIFSYFAP